MLKIIEREGGGRKGDREREGERGGAGSRGRGRDIASLRTIVRLLLLQSSYK